LKISTGRDLCGGLSYNIGSLLLRQFPAYLFGGPCHRAARRITAMIPFGRVGGFDLRDKLGLEPKALGMFSSVSPSPQHKFTPTTSL
jgi:hypothetical protein